jgi:hypothetical protein
VGTFVGATAATGRPPGSERGECSLDRCVEPDTLKERRIVMRSRKNAAGRLNVAVVGLGFGAEFVPLWQKHPNTRCEAICQRDAQKLDAVGEYFGVEKRYTDFHRLLRDPDVDVVHINSPILDHAWMSVAALKAGKHVASTVPMATTIADCKKIVDLVKKTGLTYMMMETVVYSREYLFMKELLDKGELGQLQFVQASHQQDMDGWPGYWPGLPPMWYATHCVGPVAGLIGKPAEYVSCFGSGSIREELVDRYGSPFAVETAHIKFLDSKVGGRIIRSLFDTASIPREHRRLRLQEGRRMAARRGRAARHPHCQAA